MKKGLLVLVSFGILAGGCHMRGNFPRSTFLSRFSLERSAKQTAYKGLNTSPGPIGGVGGGIGSGYVGPRGTKAGLSSNAAVRIDQEGDNRFNEIDFLEALTSQIKKEIEESHASIAGSGSPAANEFYVDYADEKIKGRITITGSLRGEYYLLRASVDEGNKRESQ
jgi:hypothetical protein